MNGIGKVRSGGSPMAEPNICVAQLGARRHYAIPSILHSRGWLSRFYTDLFAESWPIRAMSAIPIVNRTGAIRRAQARRITDLPRHFIHDFPLFGIQRMLRASGNRSTSDRYASYVEANTQFGKRVCHAGFGAANTAYVFNGAGLEIIQAAKQHGLKTIVEQTAADQAFEENLLAEERERWPNWEQANVAAEDWQQLSQREQEERELADLVVCGSDYVRESIQNVGGDTSRCAVVPYGYNTINPETRQRKSSSTLNVLFAGTLCLRKGVQYLVQAAAAMKSAGMTLRVVGPNAVSDHAQQEIQSRLDYAGVIPRAEMSGQYDWADVFVLPTLSEGSANVCYEALANGLPVITTSHAGSVIRDGREGFIVPIRSSDQIVEKLVQLRDDPDLWRAMSENAAKRAQEFTWEFYAQRLLASVSSIFAESTELLIENPAK